MAVACAAIQLTAMPTKEETKQAEPAVKKLLASERAAFKSGKMTRSEVAAAAMNFANKADTDAAKLLLMKGAFVLYVQDGNLKEAAETMEALKAAISDMPPQSVTNMIEAALLGVSKKENAARLYRLLDEAKTVKYKFSYKLEYGMAVITGVEPNPVGTLVVPDKIDGHVVTRIELRAFCDFDQLTRVALPAGLEIGSFDPAVFMHCKSLSSIEVSESNQQFASIAGVLYSKDLSTLFVYPKTRDSIELSPKTEKIRKNAFRGCALKVAKIPEGVREIEGFNFSDCQNLESVEFPTSITFLGCCVVGYCDNVKKIVFNCNAPQIDARLWRGVVFGPVPSDLVVEVRKGTKGWKSSNSTELPERWPVGQKESRTIRYIGEAKKVGAESDTLKAETHKSLEIAEGKKTYGGYTWSYRVKNDEATLMAEKDGEYSCAVSPTPTGNVSIPPTLNYIKVTSIGREAFRNCKELTSVTIPEGVKDIGHVAFKDCGELVSVTMRGERLDAPNDIFQGCDKLKSIHVPANAKSWEGMKEWLGIPLVFDAK